MDEKKWLTSKVSSSNCWYQSTISKEALEVSTVLGLFCRYIVISGSKLLQAGDFIFLRLPNTLEGWLKLSKSVKNAYPLGGLEKNEKWIHN